MLALRGSSWEHHPPIPGRLIMRGPTSHLLPDVGLWVVHVDFLGVIPDEVDEPAQSGTARG